MWGAAIIVASRLSLTKRRLVTLIENGLSPRLSGNNGLVPIMKYGLVLVIKHGLIPINGHNLNTNS